MSYFDGESLGLFGDETGAEEEFSQDYDAAGKELSVYLVDSSTDMFVSKYFEEDSTVTYFGAVTEALEADIKKRIINNPGDQVAVVFYNTRGKKNIQELEHVFVLEELGLPSAKLIKDMSTIQEGFAERIGSRTAIPESSRDNPLYNALWVAQGLFRTGGSSKNVLKRILLFTNNDDPFGEADPLAQADMRRTTIQRAKDAQDLGIQLELYPMSRPGEQFNVKIFYAEMIQIPDDESASSFMLKATSKFGDLVDAMKKKIFKKRMVRHVLFEVAEGVEFGLRSYAMVRPAKIVKEMSVTAQENIPIKAEVSLICQDTGALLTGPIKRFQQFGSARAVFTPEEVAEVKRVTSKDLKLIGFKPLSCLKDYHNLRPATFLYPDEEVVLGSFCMAIALHRAMVKLQKFALAVWGKSTQPRHVALIAQEEKLDEDGAQMEPPGFQMIFLPYFDDIRAAEKYHLWQGKPAPRATEEQVAAAAAMVKKLSVKDFSMQQIENPSLQTHYAMLQVLALNEETMPTIVDTTLPDEQSMQLPGVQKAVQDFKDAVYGPGHDEEAAAEAAKKDAGTAKRKALQDAAAEQAAREDWGELTRKGKLKIKTVEELKTCLRAIGLPVAGKKDDLCQRIAAHYGR